MLLKKIDYYATLEVHPRASEAVIAKAYRELCKIHHPDAGGSFEQMRRLNEAYEVLHDADRRAAYDLQQGRLPWRRPKASSQKAPPRRQEVGLPWWEPADPRRPLAWVTGGPRPGVSYSFERPRHPWDRPFDRRHGRVVACASCQARVLVVFKPEGPDWKRSIAWIDDQHCELCGHHAACYECPHTTSRHALEVRMLVVGHCQPLSSLWMAVR